MDMMFLAEESVPTAHWADPPARGGAEEGGNCRLDSTCVSGQFPISAVRRI
jgi:hypothetical protein